MKEQWKDIEGFDGKYQVSNLGRVKRINKNSENQVLIQFGCKIPMISLSKHGVPMQFPVCKLVADAFIENPNCYKYIRYKNGYKWNNRVSNLEFVEKCNEMELFYKVV